MDNPNISRSSASTADRQDSQNEYAGLRRRRVSTHSRGMSAPRSAETGPPVSGFGAPTGSRYVAAPTGAYTPTPMQQVPPASYGQHVPQPSYGQHVPAAAYGQHVPPASYGQHVPPASYGQHVPPASYGQHVPPASYGQHVPPPSYGPHVLQANTQTPSQAFPQGVWGAGDWQPIPAQSYREPQDSNVSHSASHGEAADSEYPDPGATRSGQFINTPNSGVRFTITSRYTGYELIEPAASLMRTDSLDSASSETSETSCLGDRPGIVKPANTLSMSVLNTGRTGVGSFDFLVRQASQKQFNVHANVKNDPEIYRDTLRALNRNGYCSMHQENETTVVCSNDARTSFVTLNLKSDKGGPAWAEDITFMGKRSAHVVHPDFSMEKNFAHASEVRSAMGARRRVHWEAMGLENPAALTKWMSAGSIYGTVESDIDDVNSVPPSTHVFTSRTTNNSVREIQTEPSIYATMEGGNFLSNGAPRGERIYLVGLDTVAANQVYMTRSDHNRPPGALTSFEAGKAQIISQLKQAEGDKVLFVEQPNFHIDMAMTFVGENEVVVADSVEFENRYGSKGLFKRKNKDVEMRVSDIGKLEDNVAQTLQTAGITVHRKAWASPHMGGPNCINGEIVKSAHTDRVYFLTNGVFDLKPKHIASVQNDVRSFFHDKGVEVAFTSETTARHTLARDGGLGCLVNAIDA